MTLLTTLNNFKFWLFLGIAQGRQKMDLNIQEKPEKLVKIY